MCYVCFMKRMREGMWLVGALLAAALLPAWVEAPRADARGAYFEYVEKRGPESRVVIRGSEEGADYEASFAWTAVFHHSVGTATGYRRGRTTNLDFAALLDSMEAAGMWRRHIDVADRLEREVKNTLLNRFWGVECWKKGFPISYTIFIRCGARSNLLCGQPGPRMSPLIAAAEGSLIRRVLGIAYADWTQKAKANARRQRFPYPPLASGLQGSPTPATNSPRP